MKTRSSTYWDRRAQQRMAEYHRDANTTIRTVTRGYQMAQEDIQSEIDKIFKTFSKDMDPKRARRFLNQKIPNPLLKLAKKWYPRVKNDQIKRWLLARMNAPAYRARISRLQALKEHIALQGKVIADVELTASRSGYLKTIRKSYYRSIFDLQRGIGIGFNFARIPVGDIEAILLNPWSGTHFSRRVWSNTEYLADQVSDVVTSGFMSGLSSAKMAQKLADIMQTGLFAASRLIRTETTYMSNAGEMAAYREAGVDQYQFMATLDSRTSEQCRKHDLKVYNVSEAKPGVNLPPLHAWCRSTTRGWFGEEAIAGMQRRARDPQTGKTMLVPANVNYEDWYKRYVLAA
ncbi:minor capsid protein [Paenibacillus sp. OK076]|uniref:minor capsid protein n=1 Tax=Paenibacillus sp. OK076 TaxID=1884379 RepID=UPI0008BFB549|nr:minor capsid protein [Paenibacillus sp. OK076]SEO11403.1 phage putative head morphogenesis protein, SPP1 gp7 family [Paenibacillus sp. OK076]